MSGNRDEWLAWRLHGLGGSDIASVVGLSPWKSRWALWAEKTGLVAEDDESEAMEFGLFAEPMVARYFTDRTGLTVAGEQLWLTAPAETWMRATVDGFVFETEADTEVNEWGLDVSDALGVLEIKCSSQSPKEWETDGIPDHYQCQAQWLMAVSGHNRVWFAVLHLAFGRPQFRVYEIERDDTDIDYLIAEGRSFWALVQSGTPPDIDGSESTTHALQRAWEGERGESVELDRGLFASLMEFRRLAEEDQAVLDKVTNLIKAEMQSATEGTIDGETVCSWRPSRAVDIEKLLIDLSAEEIEAFSRFDLSAWSKKNRKRADTYKTEPGNRRFIIKEKKT